MEFMGHKPQYEDEWMECVLIYLCNKQNIFKSECFNWFYLKKIKIFLFWNLIEIYYTLHKIKIENGKLIKLPSPRQTIYNKFLQIIKLFYASMPRMYKWSLSFALEYFNWAINWANIINIPKCKQIDSTFIC